MDVVLTPEGSAGGKWTLKDRLGRNLGSIIKPEDASDFQIQPDALGLLKSVKRRHEAMSAIASVTNGACTLDSRDWD
jgi:hypothetical protein